MKYGNILVGVGYYEQGVIIETTKINEPSKEKMNKECVIEGTGKGASCLNRKTKIVIGRKVGNPLS